MNKNVLAKVGNREILKEEMEMMIKSLGPERAAQFDNEKGREYVLNELVNQELFYLYAMASGMDGDELFKSQLETAKVNILKQYVVNKTIANVAVEENDAEEYYEKNKSNFQMPESIRTKHILVDSEEAAKSIQAEIGGGLAFEDAATKYSKCPSKENGGDLGMFGRGKMVPEFEAAAFAMNVGEISQPVKTQFGYHIIKVEEKQEPSVRAYDEVKNEIGQRLVAEKQRDVYMEKISELKKQYEVEIY
ncbi:MAG: peptidylprolyl isomerase [Peptostreptococcaceae bacterium]|nr:peptidylprolyl isomerase [Peptostreptococcaceae bacterium]